MRKQVRGVQWLTLGHIAEEVVEPGPELRPADKYLPRALFTIPQISVSFHPFLSLLWSKQGFSRLSALGTFTQLFHVL